MAVYTALEIPWCPPELREALFRGPPRPDDLQGFILDVRVERQGCGGHRSNSPESASTTKSVTAIDTTTHVNTKKSSLMPASPLSTTLPGQSR